LRCEKNGNFIVDEARYGRTLLVELTIIAQDKGGGISLDTKRCERLEHDARLTSVYLLSAAGDEILKLAARALALAAKPTANKALLLWLM
jgi:hypothetical protein